MTLQVASSTACTRSSAVRSDPPSSVTFARTKARTSARWLTSLPTRSLWAAAAMGLRHPGVVRRGALQELAGALGPRERAVPDHHRASAHDHVGAALDGAALVARVVDGHVVRLRRDRVLPVWVVDDQVGIGADRDRALLRIHPEEL